MIKTNPIRKKPLKAKLNVASSNAHRCAVYRKNQKLKVEREVEELKLLEKRNTQLKSQETSLSAEIQSCRQYMAAFNIKCQY